MDWGKIFFVLAKQCGLSKDQVYQLTLPQLEQYLKNCREDVKFQFETSSDSIVYAVSRIFGGGGGSEEGDGEYHEATEEDINMLARLLGG